jgi:hypothetical protein
LITRPSGGGWLTGPSVSTPGAESGGVLGTALSYAAPVLDFISRPQYASAKFFDSVINDSANVFDALGGALDELIDPKKKLSFSNVISRYDPQFAKNNPVATSVLGFIGDIALDPTTYLGVGLVKSGLQVGGKTLTKVGREVLERGIQKPGAAEFLVAAGMADEVAVGRALLRAEELGIPATRELASRPGLEAAQGAARLAAEEILDPALSRSLTPAERAKLGPIADELFGPTRGTIQPGAQAVIRQLAQDEVRERTEQLILRAAEVSPDLEKALFEAGGARLKLGLPFTKGIDVPGSREVLNALGVNRVIDAVKGLSHLPGITKVAGAFNRFHDIPEDYQKAILKLGNDTEANVALAIRGSQRLFKDITDPKEREAFREMLVGVQRKQDGIEAPTSQDLSQIWREELGRRQWSPQAMAALAEMEQGYKKLQEIEKLAGITAQGIKLFDQDAHEVLSTIPLEQLRRSDIIDSPVAQMDIASLHARRVVEARDALSKKIFDETLENIYGTADPKLLDKIAPKVAKDLRYFGEADGVGEQSGRLLKAFDKAQGALKTLLTRAAPSFGPRQLIQNANMALLSSGLKAYKAFDPRAFVEAAATMLGTRFGARPLPERWARHIERFIAPNSDTTQAMRLSQRNYLNTAALDDFAPNYRLTNPLGEVYTAEDVARLEKEHGITRGFDINGDKAVRELNRQLAPTDRPRLEKLRDVAKTYLSIPAMIEDYQRSLLFRNGLRMGYSPAEAAKMVNITHFDYGRGLSHFEKEWVKRFVPFYPFQRFAIPFVLKKTIERPGDVATLNKVADVIGKVTGGSGEDLTPQEREIFGQGFLVEQPRIYAGKDEQGRMTFKAGGQLLPYDVLDLIVTHGITGKVDFERTAEKALLAQLTPFLKIPAELAMGKQFFTGGTLEKAGRIGKASDETLAAALPEPIKDLIGWEAHRDGKVYVNPYLAYSAVSVFPYLRRFVTHDWSETPLNQAMDMILNVRTQYLDPKEAASDAKMFEDNTLRRIRKELREERRNLEPESYQKRLADYRELMKIIAERRAARSGVSAGGGQ